MLVSEKIGNITNIEVNNRLIDYLPLEWYETNKRILHKRTQSGKEVTLRFLKESQKLTQGDIIYEDNESVIAIDVAPCEAIIIYPATMHEMAAICYEIGNKHLPLFFQDNELLVPFETPLFNLFTSAGYVIKREERKLINPLKTSVTPHGYSLGNSVSIILEPTTSPDE